MDLAQYILVHLNLHCFSPVGDHKGTSILRREPTSPGLISILAGLKELLMKCDIWVWIIYVNEFSFRSKLLAFCLVFGFPLSLSAEVSYGCHLCNRSYTFRKLIK